MVVPVQFVLLLAFWLAISGQYSPLFVGMGVASALLVTAASHSFVAASLGPAVHGPSSWARRLGHLVVYLVWLVSRIPPAGFQVAFFVLHPRMPVRPATIRFRTALESPVARTMLANSITLVPGTLTLAAEEDGSFVVHALVPGSTDDLVSAEMQNRIAKVFLADPEPAPEVVWEPDRDTLGGAEGD